MDLMESASLAVESENLVAGQASWVQHHPQQRPNWREPGPPGSQPHRSQTMEGSSDVRPVILELNRMKAMQGLIGNWGALPTEPLIGGLTNERTLLEYYFLAEMEFDTNQKCVLYVEKR